MEDLFLARMGHYENSGQKVFEQSNIIMNHTFTRDPNYKRGNLYNTDGELLEEMIEYKYQFAFSYSFNKDKVEFLVQFRPFYHPEKKFIKEDGVERYGFYIDIPNDIRQIEKWLIFGRNETLSFVRYNVLKCNWTFKWIADGKMYSVLGSLRNRNNYNSGVWSDGFTTSVQNEAMFIIPSNEQTQTIDYDTRFMISDNRLHPKVYSVSKIEDTFPAGIIRITLKQDHYDESKDNVDLQVCNYYNSYIEPKDLTKQEDVEEDYNYGYTKDDLIEPVKYDSKIMFNGSRPILHLSGSARTVTAVITDETGREITDIEPKWHFELNEVSVIPDELEHIIISWDEENPYKFTIKVDNKATIGDVIKIMIGDEYEEFYSELELEVKA